MRFNKHQIIIVSLQFLFTLIIVLPAYPQTPVVTLTDQIGDNDGYGYGATNVPDNAELPKTSAEYNWFFDNRTSDDPRHTDYELIYTADATFTHTIDLSRFSSIQSVQFVFDVSGVQQEDGRCPPDTFARSHLYFDGIEQEEFLKINLGTWGSHVYTYPVPTSLLLDGKLEVTFDQLNSCSQPPYGDIFAIDYTALIVQGTEKIPDAPLLISPANGLEFSDHYPTFYWSGNAYAYYMEVSSTTDFSTIVFSGGTTSTNYQSKQYLPDGIFYWRVRGYTESGAPGPVSAVWQFSLKTLYITVLSPNGGENLIAGQNYNITWNSIAVDVIRIEYSTDDGSSWSPIVTNLAAGNQSYNWTVPETPSTQCLVRISDQYSEGQGYSDVSDAVFSISQERILVTFSVDISSVYPALSTSDRVGIRGSISPLSWSSSVQLSLSAGRYYTTIEFDKQLGNSQLEYKFVIDRGDGSVQWEGIVGPGDSGNRVLILYIGETALPLVNFNNTTNKIAPPVLLLPQNNFSILDQRPNFDWSDVAGSTGYTIEIDNDNSFAPALITNATETSSFTPAVSLQYGKYYWRVRSTFTAIASDWSEIWYFTISQAPPQKTISVISPNGGENWYINSIQRITWTSVNISNVKIEYSTNNGSSWLTIIQSTQSDGLYEWLIPNTLSANCKVRITDASDISVNDNTDGIFTISEKPSLVLTTPNGGENFYIGSVQYITWTSIGISNIDINYSTNNGTSWSIIVLSTPSDGVYNWTVPNTPADNCKIRITDTDNAGILDESEGVFKILQQPSLTLTSPNGGENFIVGALENITWTSTNVAEVKIEYTTNNGTTWLNVITSTPGDGSYDWTVPNTPSSNCKIRITDAANALLVDESNNIFTISVQPYISVTAPNGGEKYYIGSIQYITWTSMGVTTVNIDYTTNNGSLWSVIALSTPSDGLYNWTVPNTPSVNCRIRITNADNAAMSDQSNNLFEITQQPTIALTFPNGGENFNSGSAVDITWTSQNISNVRIDYSINNGSSWENIIPSTPDNGIFNWTIPNTSSLNCKIRISDAANSAIYDESDNVFSITSQPSITVTAPNGGEKLFVGSTQNITWTSINISHVNIEYTTNTGSSWSTLISSTLSDRLYTWMIPNTPSLNCKIRISDAANSTTYDESDNVFEISAEPYIIIKTPDANSKWYCESEYLITWEDNIDDPVDILLYEGNQFVSNIVTNTESDGEYLWKVPENSEPSDLYRIQIRSSSNNNIEADGSYFEIIQIAALTFSADNVFFGRINSDSSSERVISVRNNSPVVIKVESASISGNNFDEFTLLYTLSDSILSEETKNISIIFQPHSSGNKQAWLVVISNSSSSPDSIFLTGTAVYPVEVKCQTANLAQNISVDIIPPAGFQFTTSQFFYRKSGETNYQVINLIFLNNNYSANVPAEFSTMRGIEYYVVFSDGINTITFPENNPADEPAYIQININQISYPQPIRKSVYQMISIPLNISHPLIDSILTDDYESYNKSMWRLFRWEQSINNYLEYPDLKGGITPGHAFWLIHRDGKLFDIEGALSIPVDTSYTITLNSGWNQISNPFAFPVAWSSISHPAGITAPQFWNPDIEDVEPDQNILMPWVGYWMHNPSDNDSYLIIPPVEAANIGKSNLWNDLQSGEFILQIKSSIPGQADVHDNNNFVGMRYGAENSNDVFDVLEPPSIYQQLKFSIIAEGSEYSRNIVPVSQDGSSWDIRINSSLSGPIIRLQFEPESLPKDFKIWFIDMNRMISMPLQNDILEFQLNKGGNGIYRLIVGNEKFAENNSKNISLVPLEYILYQNFPNPFNSSTTVSYTLREKSQVTVEIYDILGNKIKSLVDDETQNPGTHNYHWDGTNSSGLQNSSGIYIYRLTANSFSQTRIMTLLK